MKKVLSIVLIFLMLFSGMGTVFGAEGLSANVAELTSESIPSDVGGTVYEEAVKALMDAKVVSGYTDNTFRPGNTLTRAEACAFLVNYLAPTEEERNAAKDSGFTDVSGWATTFVNYAVEKGIVAGYTDGTFRPGQEVKYQEMAAMTVNALGIKAEELTGGWPDAYINKAKELGMYENIAVSKGNTDEANRGDVAFMIYSLMKYKDSSAAEVAADLLAGSDKVILEAKSMSYEMLMDMSMSMGADSLNMTSTMDLELILDPFTMYMKADAELMGEREAIEYYYLTEGSDLVMYMMMEGQWYKIGMGDAASAAIPENPASDMELYLKAYDNLRMEGKDVINGRPATKIYCELSEEYIDELMADTGMMEQMMGEAPESYEDILDDTMNAMKGFGYEMWIDDETGHLTKVRMDMAKLMEEVMAQSMSLAIAEDPALAGEEYVIRIDKMLLEMVVTDIDAVDEIAVPAELKDAIDLGSSAGSEQVTE